MQIRFRIPLFIAFAVFAASCSKTNKEGKFIPEDAAVAVHINGASLSAKLPWEEVKSNELFKEMSSDSNLTTFVKQALDNPDNSGIETKTDMLFFLKKDSLGGFAAFTGTIKDAEKFRLFNLDIAKKGIESERDGVNYISKYPVCIGWNKEKFVYIANIPELKQDDYMRRYSDSAFTMKESSRDISKTCKEVFDLKEDKSLGKNEKFTELVKKTGDLHFWMNAEELNKGALTNAGLKMLNIDLEKIYKGSITTATVNFENGKILFDSKSYASKEVTELWKKYAGKVDENMLKRLPAKDVAAVIAMNFKPEGIKELIKLMGVEGYVNMGLAFAGFTLDDFVKANKGDIVLAISDFKKTADTAPVGMVERSGMFPAKPDILFAATVGDKDAFNKLMKAGEKFGKNMVMGDAPPVAYNNNGNYFAIGNSKENVDKFVNGGNSNFDFISKITGQSVGGYVNIQYILKAFENEASRDSSAKAAYDASVAFWDNAYMKGGDFSDGGTTSSFEINLMDKTTNSLKQLNKYIATLGLIAKKEKEKRDAMRAEEMSMEDLKFTPPAVVEAPSK